MMKKLALLALLALSPTAWGEGRIRNSDIASNAAIDPSKIATGFWGGTALQCSQFDHTPTPCTAGQYATGQNADGSFICSVVDGLPAQAGHAGEYLKTDGSTASWNPLGISSADLTVGTGLTISAGTGTGALLQAATVGIAAGYYLPTTSDQTTWNAKESALTFNSPLSRSTNTISCLAASGSQNGCLSSTDWTTFNNKQATISIGAFSSSPSSTGLTLSGAAINMDPADATHPGGVSTGAQTFAGAKTFSSTIVGSISGNAATSTALASNPTDCASNTYATAIDASGNLTCGAVADAGLSSTYWLLAGRSGGQIGYGGTGASELATIRSTSNGTVGSVVIADQTGEKTRIGPTGSASTFNGTHEFLTTNGSSSAVDGLIVRRNNTAAFHASSGTGNANGWAILPRGPSGSPEIRCSDNSGDGSCFLRFYDSGFGNTYGYLRIASTIAIMNHSSGIVPFWVSGTSGQTVPLQKWSNQNDGANFVSQIAKDGHFQGPNGSASVPTFSFMNDTNTGMYGDGSDALYWSAGGTRYMSLASTGLRLGVAGTTLGKLLFEGSTSGTVTVQSAATAGTWTMTLPTSAGTSGYALVTDGAGVTSWASVSGGGTTLTVLTKTTDYTLTNSDDVLAFNCSADCTLTLSSAATATAKSYRVKNIGTSNLTIARAGSDTIDRDTSLILTPGGSPQAAVTLIPSGGTAWYVF